MDMSKYNKIQALRTTLCALEAELHNMRVCAYDLPENSKERAVLRAQYTIKRKGRDFYKEALNKLVKEVSI